MGKPDKGLIGHRRGLDPISQLAKGLQAARIVIGRDLHDTRVDHCTILVGIPPGQHQRASLGLGQTCVDRHIAFVETEHEISLICGGAQNACHRTRACRNLDYS